MTSDQLEALGARVNRHLAEVACEQQVHVHNDTCAKNGHLGDDRDCRMGLPNAMQSETHTDDKYDQTQLYVQSSCPMMVPYMRALSLAGPCNMAMYLSVEMSRWLRRWTRWNALFDQGKVSAEAEPRCPSLEAVSTSASEYASKYALKVRGHF